MNKAMIYTILSILFMSLGPTINKFALKTTTPLSLVFYNAVLCCLFTIPFIHKKIFKITKAEFKFLLLAGAINGISMFFLFYGLSKSSPALVSMLNRSYILFSILIGAFILKESISKLDWGLIVFAFVGIILFMFKKDMGQYQWGAFYGIISGLLFSICNLIIKKKLVKVNEYVILFSINATSAFFFLLIGVYKDHESFNLPHEISQLAFIFFGAFVGSFLGLLFFYNSLKFIPFYKANLYRSISPAISLFVGILFFPVHLTNVNVFGLIILLSSFVIHSILKVKTMKTISQISSPDNELQMIRTEVIPENYTSVLVFIKKDKEWLMVRNKFRSWEFPGGHKELNETYIETAKREAFEEAGVDITNLLYIGYYKLSNGHTTLIVSAEVEHFHEIPEDFETLERKFVVELPSSLSFNDAVYPWLIKNLL